VEQQRQYVGIDLHRRRSVIVRITEHGEVLETVRVVNDPLKLALAMAEAGDMNRAEFLGGSILWKGWSHASTEEVPS